jgi:hypothetical protein
MPKGSVAEREVQCRACGGVFRSTRTGKGAFYCRTPECDERRARERFVTPNVNRAPADRQAAQAARQARAAERARRRREREEARRAREVQRLRARLERLEPTARARRDEAVALITRIAELERRPVEMPAWLSGGQRLDVARDALAADLLGAWAQFAAGRPLPDDDEIADLALRAVRARATASGRTACIRLAGAALARAQAIHLHQSKAAA